MVWSVRIACVAVLLVFPFAADALTESGQAGTVDFRVFAPDWTWQKRDVNVLAVFENRGAQTERVRLAIEFPSGKAGHFRYEGESEAELSVEPGQTVRHAFTGITACDGVPRQVYDFTLVVESGGAAARVVYPVRTIRGAVVNPGRWALYLPAGVAFLWSVVFALVLPRFAARGAWRTPGESVYGEEQAS